MRVLVRGLSLLVLGLALLGLGCKDLVEAPTALTYGTNPATYYLAQAIASNSPSHTGGAIDSYAVSPTLPTGLSLDPKTGIITGTPAAAAAATTYTVTATNTAGSTTASLSIEVLDPSITITTQPASQTILVGATATFSVTATGIGTLSYQWLKNSVAITGANSASYTTPATLLADSGSTFSVHISNAYGGSATSISATLTVTASLPPTITTQPSNQSVSVGQTATFSVIATGQGTLTYQWKKDGVDISGATSASYTTPVLVLADNASTYSVKVSDSTSASVTSTSATLTVLASSGGPGTFIATDNLNDYRAYHTATLLSNGKVLVVGGYNGSYMPVAELYDPATGLFTATGSLINPRYSHTATLLTNGKVLIMGGTNFGAVSNSAELYDPATGLFTATTGNLLTARADHTATLLPSGKVLLVSGRSQAGYVSTAELYDPTTGLFTTTTGAPLASRATHTATLLGTGKVLIAGGFRASNLNTAELYDPGTNAFTAITGTLSTPRAYHTATLLSNGQVLVVGGAASAVAELYNPTLGTFSDTGTLLQARDHWHAAALLPSGLVLITGGIGPGSPAPLLASAELYDPATGHFASTGSMTTVRELHTATTLPNGKVLVAGGSGFGYLNTAEIYY